MSGHTPGPWATNGSVVSARVEFSQRTVCDISTAAPSAGKRYSVDDHQPEMIANANLIAAAPGLLEALRPFANYACDPPCGCHNCAAREAVEKATGI